ncbi:DUF2214 family protein [Roseateles sp. NT4]|uniref:DUF2214 family protein n=1 Tax=Roseateles sp. NT4 TaxID=3453715 RepID=UPI003EE9AAF7
MDFVLTAAHHLLVFSLVAIVVAEYALCSYPLPQQRLRAVAALDAFYGAAAVLIVVVGALRVLHGPKGYQFYVANPMFWAKMGCFALIALLSILPTVKFIRWKRMAKADSAFIPPRAELEKVRKILCIELVLFVPLVLFAAAMARGYGY